MISFWNNNHPRQNELDSLSSLIPDFDEADTVHGELARCANRLYYDYSNNGNCNAKFPLFESCTCDGGFIYSGCDEYCDENDCEDCYEDCWDCENGQILRETQIADMFADMVDFLESHNINMDKVKDIIVSDTKCKFDKTEYQAYDQMVCDMLDVVKNTENAKRTNVQDRTS